MTRIAFSAAAVVLLSVGVALAIPLEEAKVLEVSQANDDFNGHLLQLLESQAQDGQNVFISPFSISSALAMLMAGGVNKTYTEIYNTLGYSKTAFTNEHVMQGFQRLMADLNNPTRSGGNQLSVANSVAVQRNQPVLERFMDAVTTYYGSQLFVEDFLANAKQSTDSLNAWVKEKTHDKISKLFDSPLPSDTALVLMNAIYFKGVWQYKFDPKVTKNEPFHLTRDNQEQVPLMAHHGQMHYANFDDGELLEIPYQNKTMSMFVFLPSATSPISAAKPSISSRLSTATLQSRIAQLSEHEVQLYLPKFKFEGSYQLKPALAALGIHDAFTKAADFSNIDGKKDLYVSKVVHKTFVEVNEEGSEAAAATGVVVRPKSASVHPMPRVITFRVDRPFMFFIRDNAHHLTLFSGVINRPQH